MASNYPGGSDDFPTATEIETATAPGMTTGSLGAAEHPQLHEDIGDSINALQDDLNDAMGPNGSISDAILTRVASIGRITYLGHSWVAPANQVTGASDNDYPGVAHSRTQAKFPYLVSKAFGIDPLTEIYSFYVPPVGATSDQITVLMLLPDDAMVEAVSYIPNATITGANTNSRTVEFKAASILGQSTIGRRAYLSGVNATFGQEDPIINLQSATLAPRTSGYMVGATTPALTPPILPAINKWSALGTAPYQMLSWTSTHVGGSGLLDPGGTVMVRLGIRHKNLGVSSMSLRNAHIYLGGWASAMTYQHPPVTPGTQINCSANASQGATSMTVTGLRGAMLTGGRIIFQGGATARMNAATAVSDTTINFGRTVADGQNTSGPTITSATAVFTTADIGMFVNGNAGIPANTTITAIVNSTTVTVSNSTTNSNTGQTLNIGRLSAAVTAGTQGFRSNGANSASGAANVDRYESLNPSGLTIMAHGINDAAGFVDRKIWRTCFRSVVARYCCPWYGDWTEGNVATVNGGGTWASQALPSGGQLLGWSNMGNVHNILKFTGTASGSPSATLSIGPAFEGGTIDLFFLALFGSSRGAQGTITVDGTTPPQGAVTFDTSGVATGTTAFSCGVTNGSPTLTTANASDLYVGMLVTGTNIPADTYITACTPGVSFTMSRNATPLTAGITATFVPYLPMVKRLTGLSRGAHTVTVTVTAIDSTTTAALLLFNWGVEALTPQTPFIACNIPTPGAYSDSIAAWAAFLEDDMAAVIAGTGAANGTETIEPALGSGVKIADIKTAMNSTAATPIEDNTLFQTDGVHPNARGHMAIAKTIVKAILTNYTPEQLMSR